MMKSGPDRRAAIAGLVIALVLLYIGVRVDRAAALRGRNNAATVTEAGVSSGNGVQAAFALMLVTGGVVWVQRRVRA